MICLENCSPESPYISTLLTPKKEKWKTGGEERLVHCQALLWRDLFSRSSQGWDIRKSKTNPRSPDFKCKATTELSGIGRSWVQEELRGRGLYSEGLLTNTKFSLEKKRRKVNRAQCKAKQEEEVLIIGDGKYANGGNDASVVVGLVTSLKACAKRKDFDSGSKIYDDIVRRGLLKTNVSIGNTLVSMFAKCNALEKAQEVFNELPVRNVVSWNVLIAAYAQQGHGKKALNCFEQMQQGGCFPDAFTFACILKACGNVGALDKGQEIHAQILRECLLEKDIVVSTALVDMYVKCDALDKAQEVFDELPSRNVVSWNALIAGYSRNGCGEEALSCFEKMQLEGFFPDAVTFACVLKACGSIGDLDRGEELHAQILREHFLEHHIVVANALIDMYAKCGSLQKAQEVFDKLPLRDIVSWNALVAGYAQHGHGEKALSCFEQMQLGGFTPDAATFACILRACGSIGNTEKGEEIHAQIVKEHLLEKHTMIANALVDMYAKCSLLEKAQEVFDKVLSRDLILWNTLIAGYAQHGGGEEALVCFGRMQSGGFAPDAVTFACILKACGSIGASTKGQEIHARIVKDHILGNNIVVSNALVDMYSKCGALENAREVFDKLQARNVVSWNALIAGYVQHDHSEEALKCFEQLKLEGFSPDSVTFACILKACGSMRAACQGQKLHAEIVRQGYDKRDTVVGTALVVMYANCSMLADAQDVFDELSVRDVVLWNVLIGGYAQQEQGEKTLNCLKQMQLEGFQSDAVTYACVLKACGGIGASGEGQKIHAEAVVHGWLEKSLIVSTALLVMYANCSMLLEAQDVFDELPVRDVVSWGAIMEGYSQLGKAEIVLQLFDEMTAEGIKPNWVTFIIVLNACSHRGLLEKGQMYFESINKHHGMIPTLEHHTCMVDILGRAGQFDKAVAVIEEMPLSANLRMWNTLLGACLKWENMTLGKWVFGHAVPLNEEDAAMYVCLSNIYAATGRQEGAGRIEALRGSMQASI